MDKKGELFLMPDAEEAFIYGCGGFHAWGGTGPEGYLGLEALHHPWESCGGRMILSLSIHILNKKSQ